MAEQRHQLDAKVLMAFFVAAMPFVAFGSFIVVNQARTLLRESVGSSLEQRAIQSSVGLEQYVADQVVHLRMLASGPDVAGALAAAPSPPPEAERRTLEQAWGAGKDARLAASIVDSPIAERLRRLTEFRPAFRRVQIFDSHGRLVASSSKGGRLFHGESAWFKALAEQESATEARVSEPVRSAGSHTPVFEIAFPVRDEQGSFLGAARATLDATDLYAVLAPVRVGRTGHAVLLNAADGQVLASDDSERVLAMRFPGFGMLRSAVDGFPLGDSGQKLFGSSGQRRGYWTIPEQPLTDAAGQPAGIEPARLVGFSPVQQIPGVNWLVAVEQDLDEALAPVNGVTRYLWIHFIGVFATVILMAVYFSFKLERPVMEEDLHLHEEHVPRGVTRAAS